MNGKGTDVILFGGTTEGRILAGELSARGAGVLLCVATAYAEELAGASAPLRVRTGRLDAAGMAALIESSGCGLVVDATHPYAAEVTANIRAACSQAKAEYLRLVRAATADSDCVYAADMREAAGILAREGGRALLAVGSKELEAFTDVPDYRERLVARVLPMAGVVEKCEALGFTGRQLICMQGPFSHALNVAMLRESKADWLVTKDSGEPGGFRQKLTAAGEAGARLLVVTRPVREEGLELDGMRRLLLERLALVDARPEAAPARCPRLPLFVDLQRKAAVLAGAGKVAERRVRTLLCCGASVIVIAPEAAPALAALADAGRVRWLRRAYEAGDLRQHGAALAVAATDDHDVNLLVSVEAAQAGIPCSVASDRGAGSFWFPALVSGSNVVAGLASIDGEDHGAVRRAAARLRENWGSIE